MKLVFYGFGAFVRSSASKDVYFSTVNPQRDPHMFVPLDLEKTPAAALAGKIFWGDVIADDVGEAVDKRTSIDPWNNNGGRRKGGVYIEEQYLALLRRLWKLPVPDPACQASKPHEWMSIYYYAEDPTGDSRRVGHRYLGFHAKILNRSRRKVRVWHAGTSGDPRAKAPVEIDRLDFDDPDKVDYHTGKHGHTEIGVGAGQPDEGALFLKDSYARSLKPIALEGGKKPPGEGI